MSWISFRVIWFSNDLNAAEPLRNDNLQSNISFANPWLRDLTLF